jgi:hypothetical protein
MTLSVPSSEQTWQLIIAPSTLHLLGSFTCAMSSAGGQPFRAGRVADPSARHRSKPMHD